MQSLQQTTERSRSRSKSGLYPLTSNKGGNEVIPPPKNGSKLIRYTLDWLSWSQDWRGDFIPVKPIDQRARMLSAFPLDDAFGFSGEYLTPRPGYNQALGLNNGRVDWHSERPEQKIGCQLTGKDFRALPKWGVSPVRIIGVIKAMGATVTRLDFAIDYAGQANIDDIVTAWDEGRIATPARTKSRWLEDKIVDGLIHQSQTFYIGSSSSTRRLKIYDKALELGIPGPLTRIEITVKGKRADEAVMAMIEQGIDTVGRSLIQDYCKVFGVDWFQEAMIGDIVFLPPVSREDRHTKDWLVKQCLPALKRELQSELLRHERDLYDLFADALMGSGRGFSDQALQAALSGSKGVKGE